MTTKEHYDNHLGYFYSWMTGDFNVKSTEFKKFLSDNSIAARSTGIAIDLGAGHGLQSIPLAELGFRVIAVDFNQQLLDELKINAKNLDITLVHDDIKKVRNFATKPELIVCCGDTLSHLSSKEEVKTLVEHIAESLNSNGKFILSFRDYSTALTGASRFIPVKSDENRILTCILDYENEFVTVTDLLHEKEDGAWIQKVSSYQKVRLLTDEVIEYLGANGLSIEINEVNNRMTTIIAIKV
jgi:2-polyprenyl-3-methyl-5-hydroxy-6-metoxy-1,4-benzoquinol methylase